MQVRTRLILRFMALVVFIQLCLTGFIYYYSAQARRLRFYHRLETRARQSASLLIHRLNLDPALLRRFSRADLLTMSDGRISIYDAGGRRVFHIQQNNKPVTIRDAQYLGRVQLRRPVRFRVGDSETLGMATRHRGQTYRLFMAGRDRYGGSEFATLRLILIVGNLGALGLIFVAGWYFASRSLQPLSRMVAEVEAIQAPHLHRRLDEGNGQDEIARLAMTFNRLLGGLERAFAAHKSFFAHASHELRTPLANLLGTLETSAAYDHHRPEAARSIQSAVEETQAIIDLTNGLLTLAQADEATFRRTPLALDECVVQALALCNSKYPGRPVRLEVGEWPAAADDLFAVLGNAPLLTTAVFNLLDNACKYSQDAVSVYLGYATPALVKLTVTDTGIGMAAAEVPRVVEPLYRADNGQAAPGHGLGLAITSKIIQLHGGRLVIASQLGAGTTVTVELPASV